MTLSELRLENFRSYRDKSISFSPGVNLIVGQNAQGKTNLLEAIAYCGSGKSFRAQRTAELVRLGESGASLEARVHAQEREQTIRWLLFADTRAKKLLLNGSRRKTASALAGILPSVLFCPEDLMILKAGAAQRRRLGDGVLCQLRPGYEGTLAEYNRVLERKLRILKDRFTTPQLLDVLPEYNERLCFLGARIIAYRARYYEALGKLSAEYHDRASGGRESFALQYRTVSTVTDPMADNETLYAQLKEHLQSHERAELDSAQCLTGPHRDDFEITLSGQSLKLYGSQGQTRTAAISIKLAQRELLRREYGEEPLLLLDDVLSELDAGRQDFVLNQITGGQVFITCCEPGRFSKIGTTLEIVKEI